MPTSARTSPICAPRAAIGYSDSVRGRFVTFEGIEGVGKSTQVALAAEWLRGRGLDVLTTREPGGTRLAEELRRLLLDCDHEHIAGTTELLLLFAARASHVAERIVPALERGQWVLCDRFTDATRAYQGGGRGLPAALIEQLAAIAHPGLSPDLTVLLDAPPELALARARIRSSHPDRFEQEDLGFFARVRAEYLAIAAREPRRLRTVDATAGVEAVTRAVAAVLGALLAASGR
ncbi:MAG: dTMP kinase [Gammaproteobacteria bacterium]|nr:dTMP kinase [Gammaproteobacteria bacterium]